MKRFVPLLFLIVPLTCALWFFNRSSDSKTIVTAHEEAIEDKTSSQSSFPDTLGDSDTLELASQIEATRNHAKSTKSWLDWERVALLERRMGRLTGNYRYFNNAFDSLERGFAVAPDHSGPFESRARLNMHLHRFKEAQKDVEHLEQKVIKNKGDTLTINELKAELAFHSGDLEAAEKLFKENIKNRPNSNNHVQLAKFYWKTGQLKLAKDELNNASSKSTTLNNLEQAWLYLVWGLYHLDQGQLNEALAFYRKGLELTPGDWLLEEHVAEIHMELGQYDKAISQYKSLVERTQSPEFMDQLAAIYRAQGDEAQFNAWKENAHQAHQKRMAILPEAAIGHALDHFIEIQQAPQKSLELAKKNFEYRPSGEAKQYLIHAHLLNGNLNEALPLVSDLKSSGWSTPESADLYAWVEKLQNETQRL